MNTIVRKIALISFVAILTLQLKGQEVKITPSPTSLIDIMQRLRFHDPRAPRFLLIDSKDKLSLGIGGQVCGVMEYDFNGIVNNIDFFPSHISKPGINNYARNQFQMDASPSSLFIKMVGNTGKLGDFTIYVGGNFRGNDNTFKLQNAYASFLGFTIGYDYGSFSDAVASPATVDFDGPAGQALYKVTQLRYTATFGRNWGIGAGIELPKVSSITNENLAVNTQRFPDIPIYLQYNWKTNSHIRLGGIIRSMTYNNNLDQRCHTETGWGVQTTTVFDLMKKLKVYGQITYGKGIANYFNDLSTQNVDLVPHPNKPGRMQALPTLGWYAGLRYDFSSRFFISSTYSQSRIYSANSYPENDSELYKYGQYLAVNAFLDIFRDMQAGLEYLYGRRNDFNGSKNSANRISLLVQYSF